MAGRGASETIRSLRLLTERLFFLAPLILIGASCRKPDASQTIPFQSKEWNYRGTEGIQLNSFHYEIYSTYRRQPFANALPGFLETCFQAYTKLLPTSDLPEEPMKNYLFRSRREWERFTEDFSPCRADTYKRIRRGGYSERGITVSHYSSQRGTLSILAHEGLHQFLQKTGRNRIPAWINEGLACYFESFDLNNNQPMFVPENNTLRRPGLRRALASDSLMPLREILATNAGKAVHRPSRQVGIYYSQEWSMILFLLHDQKKNPYYRGFRKLLDELGTDSLNRKAKAYLAADTDGKLSRGEAVFRAYITEDLEKFEADYRNYLFKLLDLKAY